VVFGTDASYGFCLLGRPVDEFVAMQKAGMPALDCLKSATSTAAEMLSLEGRGVLREGSRADMIVVDAGVVEDISRIEDVKAVVRGGEILEDSPGVSARRACGTALAISRGMGRTLVQAVTNRP
jgi:imidazolonepropionase-like amidohydrolase